MRLDSVELITVELPLVHPFEASYGTVTTRRSLLVRVRSGRLEGWGECVAQERPVYTGETTESAHHLLRDFAIPAILGGGRHNYRRPSDAVSRFSFIRENPMAKSALESALMDLFAKAQNVTLARSLGGRKKKVPVGVSLGIQPTPDDLMNRMERFVAEGYRRVKIKIREGWDVDIVQEARRRFPETALSVDANGAYGQEDMKKLRALDRFGLLMIEQPFPPGDFLLHSRLQKQLQTPVCLDESISNARDAWQALELDACRIVNIKPGRVGGPSEALRIHDMCRARKIPVWCGGLLETGVGRAHNVALASLPGFTLPGDISASQRYFRRDIIDPPFELRPGGYLSVPEEPGIGVKVNPRQLSRYTMKREVFTGT